MCLGVSLSLSSLPEPTRRFWSCYRSDICAALSPTAFSLPHFHIHIINVIIVIVRCYQTFLFVCFQDSVSLCNNPGCSVPHFVDQAGLELTEIHLPLSLGLKACATTAQLCYQSFSVRNNIFSTKYNTQYPHSKQTTGTTNPRWDMWALLEISFLIHFFLTSLVHFSLQTGV